MGAAGSLAKPLADGSWAVGFLNRDDHEAQDITLNAKEIEMTQGKVRDLWAHQDLEAFSGTLTLNVQPHECRVVRIRP